MDNRFAREISLIGEEKFARLTRSHVLIVGVGGVGGYVVEMLARAGVGALTLCDGDRVDITNINRQIIATTSTIGEYKCEVFKTRIAEINPDCVVNIYNCDYDTTTSAEIMRGEYDYVVDAIDSIDDKLSLILECKARGFRIISAMGAGNRYEELDFEIADIFDTSYDKLAKRMRKLLKDNGVESAAVSYTKTESLKVDGVIGSISYIPPLSGIKIAARVVNELIK